jgi:hypothetical protein
MYSTLFISITQSVQFVVTSEICCAQDRSMIAKVETSSQSHIATDG